MSVSKKLKPTRTLTIQIMFVILAFIIMVVLSYIFMSTVVRDSLVRNVDSVLSHVESQAYSELDYAKVTLDKFCTTTKDMVLRGDSTEDIKEYIDDFSYHAPLTGKSYVTDFYGYFETLSNGNSVFIKNGDEPIFDYNSENVPLYHTAITANGEIVENTPYISDNGTFFTYSKCIMDGNKVLGVMCIDVQIDNIGQSIVDIALNQGGYGMLLNQDLLVLSHPNSEFIGVGADNTIIPIHVFFDELSAGLDISEEEMTSYKGEAAVVFFRKLSNGWSLGLVTPKSQYYASLTSMAVTLSLLGAALAAILISILFRIDKARIKSNDESQRKSMFLSNMSHEIRTPINAIVGMTAIGRAAGTSERKDYCFAKIDNASKHLLGVVNDILDMSKIEANKIELSNTDFNFEKMLQQVINVINFRADEKRQKLMVHIDKAIPKILLADDQRLAQVITNLLSNAVKFTPEEGLISLKANLLSEENGVYTLKIDVTDTGIGISPEQQARLFQSFQQAESSTTRKYGGTGLGLAISKSIVEMMHGKIWVDSELGKGATISFTAEVGLGDPSKFNFNHSEINWNNIRVLVVDDDPDILAYFSEIMTSFGSKCDVARSAEEALKLVAHNSEYNIYFIDLRMPGVNGIDLTKTLRSREKNPGESIVIMISSADLDDVESDAKQSGVNRFLLKPLFPSSIADVISECIGIVNDKIDELPANISGIFAKRCILFAEDVDINREIVLSLLEPTEIEIDCAKNGVEAVKMFNQSPNKYEMIFMDVQMPEMDGYEATQRIRTLDVPNAKTVPIVAMTANVFKEDIETCLSVGMNDHLGKPLNMDSLLATMIKYLDKTPIY